MATLGAFATQGFVFISLTTRLPEFSDRWDLSDLELSGLLLMMVLLAGAGSVVAERLAKGSDSATVLRLGLGLMAVAVPVLTLAPVAALFVLGLAAYGVSLGLVDATTNMQAVALEHRYERPILPSFHGAWTVGGITGAAVTLATPDLPLEAGAALAVIPLVALCAPFLRRDHGATATAESVAVPWRPIVLVGVALVLFYMVDTAAATWGPTYLDDTFSTPEGLVALATFPYLIASGLIRLSGDTLRPEVRRGDGAASRSAPCVGCACGHRLRAGAGRWRCSASRSWAPGWRSSPRSASRRPRALPEPTTSIPRSDRPGSTP